MDSDDVIKRIIMLTLLLFVDTGTTSTRALVLLVGLILIVAIVLLSMTQIEGLSIFIPESLLDKGVWLVVFICAILIFVIKLLSY